MLARGAKNPDARYDHQPVQREVDRNAALDFAKGVLVLFMVLYHWINYFVSTEGFFYRYIRFVTPSFIFITGFLVTNVYLAKYGKSGYPATKRLLQRGAKLLLLFTCLNILANLVVTRNYNARALGLDSFFRNAPSIYTTGMGEAAAFEILVPIAYLLLISPLALLASRRFKYALHAMCLLLFLAVLILGLQDISSYNLDLLAVGSLGSIVGYVPAEAFNRLAKQLGWIVAVYIVYLVVITIWGAAYPLQIVGVCLSVLLIYCVGVCCGDKGIAQRHVILLGKYSLLAYVAQIAMLQLLRRILPGASPGSSNYVVSFISSFALTSGVVVIVDRLRMRSKIIDWHYRLVFC